MMLFVRVVLVLLLFAAPASAQLLGNWGVGVGVGKVKTTAPELESKVTVQPIISRRPSEGWGLAFAFNWFSADVNGSVVGETERLGRVHTRPVLLGVAYTFVKGKFALAPGLVAGPSVNTLKIDDEWDGIFEVEGSSFERKVGSVSFATRPGVSATYALSSHWGLGGFAGYIFNRPQFDIRTPDGVIESKWDGDGIVLSTGIVFTF
jgi:hypothetical protein